MILARLSYTVTSDFISRHLLELAEKGCLGGGARPEDSRVRGQETTVIWSLT